MSRTSTMENRISEHLGTPSDLKADAIRDISAALGGLLADTFALYLKTKNFHWHMSGPALPRLPPAPRRASRPDLRDDRPDRGARSQIAEPPSARISDIARRKRLPDNDADYVDPRHARGAVRRQQELRPSCAEVHHTVDGHGDVATASLLENWIDETERRTWFLFESTRNRGG